jgi:Zn finger protein HypA/HybF involved in hydrogenase expression
MYNKAILTTIKEYKMKKQTKCKECESKVAVPEYFGLCEKCYKEHQIYMADQARDMQIDDKELFSSLYSGKVIGGERL